MNDKKEPTTKTNVNELIKKEEEKNKGPATSVLEIIDRLNDDGQFAFYNVVDQEDESGKTTHVYYPVGEPLDETPNKIFAIGSRNDGFATADIIPDANEDLRNIDQLNKRIEELKKTAATRDNSGDQITDGRHISEYRKDGYHVVTNSEIADGKYQKPEYAGNIVKSRFNLKYAGVSTFEIEYKNGEKIVMTARQSDVYVKFRELYLTPGLFNYNDLRRMLDVINLTLDNSAAELMQLFNRYATPGANQNELNQILTQIETLTGIAITRNDNGAVDYSIISPVRTAQGLQKAATSDVLKSAMTLFNQLRDFADVDPNDPNAIKLRAADHNKMFAHRSHRQTVTDMAVMQRSIQQDDNGEIITRYEPSKAKIIKITDKAITTVTLPTPAKIKNKQSNYYWVWYELIKLATRDMLDNPDNPHGEFTVPYKYFADEKLYNRALDVKRALYKNEDFKEFITETHAATMPNPNNPHGEYSVPTQIKKKKERNGQPLEEYTPIFTHIAFYDDYFVVNYDIKFDWEMFYSYFAPFPDGWQALPQNAKSLLFAIINNWRATVGNITPAKNDDITALIKNKAQTITLLNRTIQQQIIGKYEKETVKDENGNLREIPIKNATVQIKKPIIDIVNILNKWFKDNQPEPFQIKLKFNKPTGYGSISEFLDNNGVIVTFGSAYLDYGAEELQKKRDNIIKKNKEKKDPDRNIKLHN